MVDDATRDWLEKRLHELEQRHTALADRLAEIREQQTAHSVRLDYIPHVIRPDIDASERRVRDKINDLRVETNEKFASGLERHAQETEFNVTRELQQQMQMQHKMNANLRTWLGIGAAFFALLIAGGQRALDVLMGVSG